MIHHHVLTSGQPESSVAFYHYNIREGASEPNQNRVNVSFVVCCFQVVIYMVVTVNGSIGDCDEGCVVRPSSRDGGQTVAYRSYGQANIDRRCNCLAPNRSVTAHDFAYPSY
jgi:hypothetical protein